MMNTEQWWKEAVLVISRKRKAQLRATPATKTEIGMFNGYVDCFDSRNWQYR